MQLKLAVVLTYKCFFKLDVEFLDDDVFSLVKAELSLDCDVPLFCLLCLFYL